MLCASLKTPRLRHRQRSDCKPSCNFIRSRWHFQIKRRTTNNTEVCVFGENIFLALLPTGFRKSLVKHSSLLHLVSGGFCVANVTPCTNRKPRVVATWISRHEEIWMCDCLFSRLQSFASPLQKLSTGYTRWAKQGEKSDLGSIQLAWLEKVHLIVLLTH